MTTVAMTLGIIIGSAGIADGQNDKKFPQTKITMIVDAPIDSAFNYIVPVSLPRIFKRYKNLPAVSRTDEKETWIKAGLTRTVYFEDGSTSKETLLTVVPYTSFSYRIEDFTSQLRFLAKQIEGDWLFTDLGAGKTKIEWTYKVVPKNFLARGLIKLVLLKNIRGLLTNALTTLKSDLGKTDPARDGRS